MSLPGPLADIIAAASESVHTLYGLDFRGDGPPRPPHFKTAPLQRILLTATVTSLIVAMLYTITQELTKKRPKQPAQVAEDAASKAPLLRMDTDMAMVLRALPGSAKAAAIMQTADALRAAAKLKRASKKGASQGGDASRAPSSTAGDAMRAAQRPGRPSDKPASAELPSRPGHATPQRSMPSRGGSPSSGRSSQASTTKRWAPVEAMEPPAITSNCGTWVRPPSKYTPPPRAFTVPARKDGSAPRYLRPSSPGLTSAANGTGAAGGEAGAELASLLELGLVQRQFRSQAKALSLRTAPTAPPRAPPRAPPTSSFAGDDGIGGARGGGAMGLPATAGAPSDGASEVLEWCPQPVSARTMGVSPRRLAGILAGPILPPASALPAPARVVARTGPPPPTPAPPVPTAPPERRESGVPAVGPAVGPAAGPAVGLAVGPAVGLAAGSAVGLAAGPAVGLAAGPAVGPAAGPALAAAPLEVEAGREGRAEPAEVPAASRAQSGDGADQEEERAGNPVVDA